MEIFKIREKIEEFAENLCYSQKNSYQVILAKCTKLFNLDMRLNELEEMGVPDSPSEREQYYDEIEAIRKEVEEIIGS